MGVQCSVDIEWNSAGGSGNITTVAGNIGYVALDLLDTSSGAPTPETLLIGAMSSSYSIALSKTLIAASLPHVRVSVRGTGIIRSNCGKARFVRITVNPTIQGADLLRREAYENAATAARDDCLVGRSVRGNVAYVIGEVVLLHSTR